MKHFEKAFLFDIVIYVKWICFLYVKMYGSENIIKHFDKAILFNIVMILYDQRQ